MIVRDAIAAALVLKLVAEKHLEADIKVAKGAVDATQVVAANIAAAALDGTASVRHPHGRENASLHAAE